MGCQESHSALSVEVASEDDRDRLLVPHGMDRADAPASAGSPEASGCEDGAPDEKHAEPRGGEGADSVRVALERGEGSRFGFRLVDTGAETGLRIASISAEGVLSQWNEQHCAEAIVLGDRVVEVNGVKDHWGIMEEMRKCTVMEMVVYRRPPDSAEVLQRCSVPEALLRSTSTVLKRTARAGDVGTVDCAICMEDIGPDERIAHLMCGHGFHQKCILRWMRQHDCKEASCPLCRSAVR